MAFGSVFSKFKEFNATTADGKSITFKNNFITKIGFLILGVPHIGMRLRARKIVKNFPERVKIMLDAGCGTGIYSFALAEKVDNINSVDLSSEKISDARKINIFNNIDFSEGDLCKLNFEKNHFEVVICSDVLEHIKNDEKAFSELSRVLKSGGTLLLTVPYDSEENRKTYKKYEHERAGYKKEYFESLCKKDNLAIKSLEGYSYPVADKISNFSYRLIDKKIFLGLLFYPLYFLSIVADYFHKGKSEPNGIFLKFVKN